MSAFPSSSSLRPPGDGEVGVPGAARSAWLPIASLPFLLLVGNDDLDRVRVRREPSRTDRGALDARQVQQVARRLSSAGACDQVADVLLFLRGELVGVGRLGLHLDGG